MRASTLLVPAICLQVLLSSASASAFCRSTTVPAPVDFVPNGSCWHEGIPLFWKPRCVTYRFSEKESRFITNADASAVFDRAFAAWTGQNAACKPSLVAVELAPTANSTARYLIDHTNPLNENLIVFRDDDWRFAGAGEQLERTTVTFDIGTGEIYDADIEINTASYTMTTATPVPSNGYDFETVAVHAAGHFLGLAHADSISAVMSPTYVPGSMRRSLGPDDAAGICEIYRPGWMRKVEGGALIPAGPCELAPGTPGQSCGSADVGHGCSATPGSASGAGWAALASLALVATRRRWGRRSGALAALTGARKLASPP